MYVFGSIRVDEFKRFDGTRGTALVTRAHLIYVCESDEMPINLIPSASDPIVDCLSEEATDAPTFAINDLNYVEINAPICYDIQNKEKLSVFTVASQHIKQLIYMIRLSFVKFVLKIIIFKFFSEILRE